MKLQERKSSRLKKQGGFTLIEMLIVVAIIAILVMVSIPIVNNSLTKAKQATDDANERAAKAVAAIEYLNEKVNEGTYYYNANTGKLVTTLKDAKPAYGQMKNGKVVKVTIDDAGTIKIDWE